MFQQCSVTLTVLAAALAWILRCVVYPKLPGRKIPRHRLHAEAICCRRFMDTTPNELKLSTVGYVDLQAGDAAEWTVRLVPATSRGFFLRRVGRIP